jgi:hypothetical protein
MRAPPFPFFAEASLGLAVSLVQAHVNVAAGIARCVVVRAGDEPVERQHAVDEAGHGCHPFRVSLSFLGGQLPAARQLGFGRIFRSKRCPQEGPGRAIGVEEDVLRRAATPSGYTPPDGS